MNTIKHLSVDMTALPCAEQPIYNKLFSILKVRVEERSGARVVPVAGQVAVRFELDPSLPADAYTISDMEHGLLIQGADFRGLMYGLGQFLHKSQYDETGMCVTDWRGTSTPDCPVRTLYFALHFYNGYHMMTPEDLVRNLEDVMLWGFNGVCANYARVSLHDFSDPNAEHNFRLIETLFSAAKSLKMTTSVLLGTVDFMDTVPELAADKTGIFGKGGNALCPSRPGGYERISYINMTVVRRLAHIGLDYVILWPYDEGGCSCELCAPWGGNGYYRWAKRQYQEICSEIANPPKAILCTWHFGLGINDPRDFAWLDRAIREDRANGDDWISYMLLETRRGIPEFVQKNGIPGGLPALDFPEITMRYLNPWGGWGATPLPTEVERMWRQLPGGVNGGVCYTEGFYDDVNKAVIASLMYDGSLTTRDVFTDYCGYEFRAELADDFWTMCNLMEYNQMRTFHTNKEAPDMEKAALARDLGEKLNNALPESLRTRWQWRLMYLRSVLDYERYTAGQPHNWGFDQLDGKSSFAHWGQFLVGNQKAQDALWELIELYRMPHQYDPEFHVLHYYIRPNHQTNPAYL